MTKITRWDKRSSPDGEIWVRTVPVDDLKPIKPIGSLGSSVLTVFRTERTTAHEATPLGREENPQMRPSCARSEEPKDSQLALPRFGDGLVGPCPGPWIGPTSTSRREPADAQKTRRAGLAAQSDSSVVRPILRWAGGKAWLVQKYPRLLDVPHVRYLEPFLGGAALFLHANPSTSVISDANREVIACYEEVATAPSAIWELYRHLVEAHSPENYLRLRKSRPASRLERATRLLYLNRSCFNGIYRVNRAGDFNVPLGSTRFHELTEASLIAFSQRVQRATMTCGDFQTVTSKAEAGDLLVLDPPYRVIESSDGFVRYNERVFTWADQERLASEATLAAKRGVTVLATNAAHPSVVKLYPREEFSFRRVARKSAVAASSDSRGNYFEILIKSRNGDSG